MRPIPILAMVTTFRERLAATIRAARPILEEPGVLVPGLLLEKLVTERTGEKGDRDLLVALALLSVGRPDDLDTFDEQYRRLRPDLRHGIRSNLTILSLLPSGSRKSQRRDASPSASAARSSPRSGSF